MKYAILIKPDEEIEIKEYVDFHTIQELVDGCFEGCGVFGVLNKMVLLFCNDEFLLRDDTTFNAIGTIFADQPVYGNVVVLEDGYNDEYERDAIPFSKDDAESLHDAMVNFKYFFRDIIDTLHSHYDNNKPEPHFEFKAVTAEELSDRFFDKSEDCHEEV